MKSIDGVLVVPLKKVPSERGHLVEVQREDDSHFPGFGQAYITCTSPAVVKAWYRHHQQCDQIALIKGEVVLVMYDPREDSLTRGALQKVDITEQNPRLVQIPPGIWHGFKALGTEARYLLHLNSVGFKVEDTDEDRLPSDTPSIPYGW